MRLALDSPRLPSSTPTRTCVGCRARAAKSELLRVTASARTPQGVVVAPDPRAQNPGRGAYVHPTPECVAQAVRRRAFTRALRVAAVASTTAVSQWVAGPGTASGDDAPASAART